MQYSCYLQQLLLCCSAKASDWWSLQVIYYIDLKWSDKRWNNDKSGVKNAFCSTNDKWVPQENRIAVLKFSRVLTVGNNRWLFFIKHKWATSSLAHIQFMRDNKRFSPSYSCENSRTKLAHPGSRDFNEPQLNAEAWQHCFDKHSVQTVCPRFMQLTNLWIYVGIWLENCPA